MKDQGQENGKALHAHHRQRMFNRAREHGFEHFEDHELLEILLYFSKPRVNTNPTAHELLERYDSIKGVMDASVDELCMQEGIGPQSALLIKLVTDMARRYERDCFEIPSTFRTLEKVAQYLHPKFMSLNGEGLYAMYFNNRMKLLECKLHAEGTINATEVLLSRISSTALQNKASAVILAHNHPNGLPQPSPEDRDLNLEVRRQLGVFGIVLVEHLIFADKVYSAMMRDEGLYRISPMTHHQDVGFYQKFYQNCPMEIPRVFGEKSEK